MLGMATENLSLNREADGYWRTSWYDDGGYRHRKSFGTAKGRAANRFNRFHAEWRSDWHVRNPSDEGPLVIAAAWERFKAHAEAYYRRPDGTPTGEAANFADAMRPVIDLMGDLPVDQFGPKALQAVRDEMIVEDLAINTINARVRRIRHLWKWLAAEELASATVWHGLQAVEALQRGRSAARTTEAVGPVPDAYVWQTCEHLTPTLRAMVEFQYWTGARPGETCALRPIDLDTTGPVWIYRTRSKTEHYTNRPRSILVGPRAQAAIKTFLARDIMAHVFSAIESRRQAFGVCETHRHQSVIPPKTARRIGSKFTAKAYGNSIRRTCRDHDIPHWSPNQLRHNALTRVRKQGLDVAQIVAGHARADTTQIYAEVDLAKAAEIVFRIG